MIISCPSCNARYKVRDELAQNKTKRVKCKKCGEVFAPSDNAMSSEIKVTTGPPQQAKPQAPSKPANDANSASATVMIDTRKIQEMAKQQAAAELKNTADRPPQAAKESQQTMRMDAAQIQSAMAKSASSVGADHPEQTLAISPEELARKQQEMLAAMHASPAPTVRDTPNSASTVRIDPGSLKNLVKEEMNHAFDEDGAEEGANFGAETVQMASPFATDLGDADIPDISPKPQAPPVVQSPSFSSPEPAPAPAPAPPPKRKEEPPVPTFQARIEGSVYPDLTFEVLDRWIKEGRLLESDEVAGAKGQFLPASSFPQLKGSFEKYFGSGESAPVEEAPKKKKGFFARLFGR